MSSLFLPQMITLFIFIHFSLTVNLFFISEIHNLVASDNRSLYIVMWNLFSAKLL